jgi:hypothetical protein
MRWYKVVITLNPLVHVFQHHDVPRPRRFQNLFTNSRPQGLPDFSLSVLELVHTFWHWFVLKYVYRGRRVMEYSSVGVPHSFPMSCTEGSKSSICVGFVNLAHVSRKCYAQNVRTMCVITRVSCKCCAHLPRATRDVTFGPRCTVRLISGYHSAIPRHVNRRLCMNETPMLVYQFIFRSSPRSWHKHILSLPSTARSHHSLFFSNPIIPALPWPLISGKPRHPYQRQEKIISGMRYLNHQQMTKSFSQWSSVVWH